MSSSAHPSNLIEYGYPLGTLNWTGDDPCIFPVDCPNFGGFTSSTTVIRADWWKLGQVKAGNTLKYIRVGLQDALEKRRQNDDFLDAIDQPLKTRNDFTGVESLQNSHVGFHECDIGKAVIWEKHADGRTPQVRYLSSRRGRSHSCRIWQRIFRPQSPREDLVAHLQIIEEQLGDLSTTKVLTRVFKLPISFESKSQDEATQRYMTNQRPHAPYLPDNLAFVAKNNAFTKQQLKDIYLTDSPGGYQMTGRTVPCWDYYSYKPGFGDKPWIFRDLVDESTMEKLLDDPSMVSVEAPVDANVWKVEVSEGDEVGEATVVTVLDETNSIQIVILEAMKLEIAVKTPDDVAKSGKLRVENMLVKPGDTVTAGGHLALLRRTTWELRGKNE
ncbi:hypothetical protein ACEQ8H_008548 [Pleosporales sp. CAS-2024a]